MWGLGALGAALLLLVVCFNSLDSQGGESVLLGLVHSAKYYQALANMDSWQSGPHVALKAPAPLKADKARLQSLTLTGSARPLNEGAIKACASGNDRACAQLAAHPTEIKQLRQAVDTRDAAVRVSHRASPRVIPAKATPISWKTWQALSAPKAVAPTVSPKAVAPTVTPAMQDAMIDQDRKDAGNVWNVANWQSGALGDVVSDQWLKSCGEGNQEACNQIAKSQGALNSLLTSSYNPGPPIQAYIPASVPKAVYSVKKAPKSHSQGFMGEVLSALGLGDSYYNSGVKHQGKIPKMVPDRGFAKGPKYSAVWNDGTVAPELSDESGTKLNLAADASKAWNVDLFGDSVQQKPADQKWH